jgi:hypothetical protein
VGSYNCTCYAGYIGDGFDCSCSDGDLLVIIRPLNGRDYPT